MIACDGGAGYAARMRQTLIVLISVLTIVGPLPARAEAPDVARLVKTMGELTAASEICQRYKVDHERLAAYAHLDRAALDAFMQAHDGEIRHTAEGQRDLADTNPRAYCTTAWRSFGPKGLVSELLVVN